MLNDPLAVETTNPPAVLVGVVVARYACWACLVTLTVTGMVEARPESAVSISRF